MRQWPRTIRVVGGAIVVLLALASVFYTAKFSQDQTRYVRCSAQTLRDTVAAIKLRDAVQLQLNASTQFVSGARHTLLVAQTDALAGRPADVDRAQREYNVAYDAWRIDQENVRATLVSAPLPTIICFE